MKRREMMLGLLAVVPFAQARAQTQQPAQRRRVVPLNVINRFGLKPSNGYGPYVLGEDGRPYDFDDVVAVLFEVTRELWAARK